MGHDDRCPVRSLHASGSHHAGVHSPPLWRLTGYFLWRLGGWLGQREAFGTFISVPHKNQNAGIFAIVASLAMTANVFWAPLGFFVPWVSSNLQAWMPPSLIFFGVLFFALIFLEVKANRTWFAKNVDRTQFNFIWLLAGR